YTTARVGANGALALGGAALDITNGNAAFPSTANTAGNVLLCPFWDDLDDLVADGSNVYTQQVGNLYIIEWYQWGHFSHTTAGETVKFEIQLNLTTGQIFFVYQDVNFNGSQAANNAGASATVGIQWAATAGSFIQYSFNTASLADGQVISYTPNNATVQWSPSTFLSSAFVTNPVANNVTTSTTYQVSATANGCTATSAPFTLTVDPPPAATVTSVPDCANNQWSVALNVTSVGTGSNVTFRYTVNGGAPVTIGPYIVGSVIPNLGPYTPNDIVNVTLLHQSNTACNVAYGNFYTTCPFEIVCPTVVPVTHCYGHGDTRTFWFHTTSPGETVTVTFISGTMDPADVIRAYSGTDNSGVPIGSLTGTFANLAGASGSSTGTDLFIEIDAPSNNTCQNGGAQTTWSFQAQCTPGCVTPNGSVTTTPICASQQFTADVEITDQGDAAFVNVDYTVNGGSHQFDNGHLIFDIVNVGPFNLGVVVHV
ncbi:MAG TPA: hypothetical protein PK760_09495, partial [Flavobacteriales bacterium]|nr:hypothetical protein [Flavobacteriales bacterium]